MFGHLETWGFPKIGGTFWGVPIIRIIVFWGLYPPILGNHQITKPDDLLRRGPRLAALGVGIVEEPAARSF